MLSRLSEARRFRLALLVWRGVQTATPLLLARWMDDPGFNRFAALLGAVQVMAGIIAFGQNQFSYTALQSQQGRHRSSGIDPLARRITTAWLVLCVVLLAALPLGVNAPQGAQVVALALAAHALALVELLTAQSLVNNQHHRAAVIYAVSSAAYVVVLLPVVVSRQPDAMVWAGLAGLVSLAWMWWPRAEPAGPGPAGQQPDSASLVRRLRFGSTQTVILLLSGAVPLMLHNLLPQVGIDLKGSKYISLFGTVSGLAIFIGNSGVVTRSAEIGRQSLAEAEASIDRAIRQMALSASPVLVGSMVAEWLVLGSVTPVLALACWGFAVAQMTVSHIRYVLFAHQVLTWDLWANLLPFAAVAAGSAAWMLLVPGSRGPLVPVAILTSLALASATLYRMALWRLAHRRHRAP